MNEFASLPGRPDDLLTLEEIVVGLCAPQALAEGRIFKRVLRRTVTLGRYLSRLAIERHGGCIWLESEEGRGSTFYFSLPEAMGRRDGFAAPNPLSSVAPGE